MRTLQNKTLVLAAKVTRFVCFCGRRACYQSLLLPECFLHIWTALKRYWDSKIYKVYSDSQCSYSLLYAKLRKLLDSSLFPWRVAKAKVFFCLFPIKLVVLKVILVSQCSYIWWSSWKICNILRMRQTYWNIRVTCSQWYNTACSNETFDKI